MPELVAPAAADADVLEWSLVAGEESVVVVDPALLSSLQGGEARLDDGSSLIVQPYTLRVELASLAEASDPTSPAARVGWWLGLSDGGRTQKWSSERRTAPSNIAAKATTSTGKGELAVVLIAPSGDRATSASSEAAGQVGGHRVKVRRLSSPPLDAKLQEVFSRAVHEEAWESVWIRASLAMLETSPLTRWRARLLSGTLVAGPEGEGASASPRAAKIHRFSDPVAEALARSVEAQWASGLASLANQDAFTARQVVKRLCAVVDAGGGVFVPAWTPEGNELAALLESLTVEQPSRQLEAAQAWLRSTDAILRWVVDDSGAPDVVTGEPVGTLGVANLTDAPLAAWIEAAPGTATSEILAIGPWTARRVVATRPGAASDEAKRPVGVATETAAKGERAPLRVGDASFSPTLYTAPTPAVAPGVVIGPFYPDWRMADWMSAGRDDEFSKRLGPWSKATLADGGWGTSGLIYRGVDAPIGDASAAPDRWLLYVEMKDGESGRGVVPGDGESLRVWFGRFGRSQIVLKVLNDGRVIDESPPAPEAGANRDLPRIARVSRRANGWACWLALPVSAIENNGIVRVGVERVDRRGVRSSWPRPSLPWQQEPSRISIDTKVWASQK